MDPDDKRQLEIDNLMLIIALIICIAIIVGLVLAWPAKAQEKPQPPRITLRVEESTNQGIIALPIISPHFDMETVGDIAPDKGDILNCSITHGTKVFIDHSEKYLLFGCTRPPGKSTQPTYFNLRLTGLAFEKETN